MLTRKLHAPEFGFVWFNVRQHNNGYIDVSVWERNYQLRGLRIANEIKRVYTPETSGVKLGS
jgi:hypothetical protein